MHAVQIALMRSELDEFHWHAQTATGAVDLTTAGLQPKLSDLACCLLDKKRYAALLAVAPQVTSGGWSRVRPGRPGKALAIGKNFAAHAREFGDEPSDDLVWFTKLPDILIGPGEPIVVPAWLDGRVDPEAEVVVLVGATLHHATVEQAQQAIAALTLGNDVTARSLQAQDKKQGRPWLRSKNLMSFGVIGPHWTPVQTVPDWQMGTLMGSVNGQVRQQGALADMIFSPARALSIISQYLPILAGDIVFMGTPAGVGGIVPGDVVSVEAQGLGRLENPVVAG